MDKISNTPFYNYNVSLKASNEALQTSHNENKLQNFSNEYMSSDVSSASRAYGLSFVKKDMVKWFESQGKIEGKDFEIDSSCTMGITVLTLKNKQGQEELTILYGNGNHNKWNGYEVSEYTNGKLYKKTSRDENGNIRFNLQVYKNDEVGHLLEEGLSYNTTPEEYIKYLKSKNVDYKIEYSGEEDNNRSLRISLLNDNKQVYKKVRYYYGSHKFNERCRWVTQSDINEQGEEYRRLFFNKDKSRLFR